MKFWLLFWGILSLCTGTRAECCLDRDVAKGICKNIPESGLIHCDWYCKDGTKRVGAYCSKGSCNIFGCNCDGGCIEGQSFYSLNFKRRLFSESQTLDDEPSSSKSTVGRCQDQIVSMYNTTVFREQEQILAYYNCLQTVSDGILDTNDAVIQELQNSPNGTALLKSMDSNGNDGIEPGEFDSGLDSVSQSSGWSKVPSLFGMTVLSGFPLVFFT